MPSRAFTLSKTRLQSNKLTRTLRSNFSAQPDVRSAAVLGNKLIAVGGSLYDSTVGSDSIGEAVAVVNVGRPAAAVYAPSSGGAAVVSVSGSSGGGSGATSFSQLAGTISDGQAPQFLKTDGSRALTGSMAVYPGVTIDGVDLDVHAANPDAHHDRATGGSGITVTGQTVSVDQAYGFVWTAQHQFAAGLLATHVGAVSSLTIDPVNDLTIDPGGIVYFPVAQAIRTPGFSSSFPINGFNLTQTSIAGQSGLTIGVIVADELRVRVFVADETRVDRGEKYDSKSYGILAADFVTPSLIGSSVRIYFEDSPALNGAIFSNNDWLLFRVLDISTGLTVASIWGQVTGYIDEPNDQQSWLFTMRQGLGGYTIKKGRLAVDWGVSGQGLIHYSTVDPNGAPYIEMLYWQGANPYTPANYTKVVRFGNLKSSYDYFANAYGFAAGDFAGGWLGIDAANGLRVMSGTLPRLIVDSAGNFNIYNSAGAAVITLDNAGQSYFAGAMTLGLSGGIYQGTGSFAAPTTGLKIWNNAGKGSIGGYNASTLQWVADTDGRIKAGQNNVQLSYFGLDLVAYNGADPNPTENVRALAFWDSLASINGVNKPAGRIWGAAAAGGGQYGLQFEAIHPTLPGAYPKAWLTWDNTGKYFVITDVDHLWLSGNSDVIISGPLALASTTTVHNVVPADSLAYSLGSPGAYFDKLYVNQIVANSVTGTTALGGQIWQYDTGDMYVRSTSAGNRTLYISNPGTGTINLDVEGSITLGGTVDGVDISGFYSAYGTLASSYSTLSSAYSTHTANPNAHHNQSHVLATTTGLGADHTVSGLTAGQVLQATGPTTVAFVALTIAHSALAGLSSGDDHPQYLNQSRGDARYFKSTGGAITGQTTISETIVPALILSTTSGAPWALTLYRADTGNSTGLRNAGGFVEFQDTPKVVGSNAIWHAGNDGSGSGLDADTVDGLHGAELVTTTVARSITAQHSFAPGATQAPFVLGLNAQNQTVIGLRAASVNINVNTAASLTGGGPLTTDLTLGVNLANAFTWAANHTWSSGNINLTSGDIQANGVSWLLNTRRIRGSAGSNSVPTYSFITDSNTGMYSGGNGILSLTVSGTDVIQLNSQRLNPASSGVYHVGDYNRKFGTLFVTEMYAQTLVAQSVMATVGGRVAVAPTSQLIADVVKPIATIDVKYNIFQVGDFIYLESSPAGIPQFEAMKVVATPTAITGGYRYKVLRAVNNGYAALLIATLGTGSTVDVDVNALSVGDTIYITDDADINSEFMTVTAGPTTIAGGYRYTVTRGAGGSTVISGSTAGTYVGRVTRTWNKGDAIIDLGNSLGQGYIDITSTSTILNHFGPTIAIYCRTNFANWNALAPVVAIGNLRSFVDYTGDMFGWAVGNNLTLSPTGGFKGMTADVTNGLRLFNVECRQYLGATEFLRIDTQGISILSDTDIRTGNSIVWYNNAIGPNINDISAVGYISGYRILNHNAMVIGSIPHGSNAMTSIVAVNENGDSQDINIRGQSTTYPQTGHIEYHADNHYMYETTYNMGVYVNAGGVIIGQNANLSILNGIYFTRIWGGQASAEYSEISNDRNSFRQLMIVGNTSSGTGLRRVGLWDQVQIGGAGFNQTLNVSGSIYVTASIGVGVTSPGYTVDVAGSVHATSFPTSSDVRLKNILAPVMGVLDRLEKISAYTFTWKPGYHAYSQFLDERGEPQTQIGFIAQEIYDQYPELVTRWQHGGQIPLPDAMAVDYSRVIPLLLMAIRELRQEVESLRKAV